MSRIKSLNAHTIPDSRGELTIEVVIELETGEKVVASIPQGKSTGSHEAHYLSAVEAVSSVNTAIFEALGDLDISDQTKVDGTLINLDGTSDKSKLGANAILGVSIACAKITALEKKIPLWKYIRTIYEGEVRATPRLYMNLINGGLHAKNGLDFQEYIIIPKTKTIKESVEYGIRFYEELKVHIGQTIKGDVLLGDEGGFAPNISDNLLPFEYFLKIVKKFKGIHVDFGLDAAASNIKKNIDEISNLYREMKNKFNIIYLEDPYSENDILNFKLITQELGNSMVIAGDDLTTTNPKQIRKFAKEKIANGVIIKPNQIGTISEALDAVKVARENNWSVVVSHRSGETEDTFIADFAWAVGADGIKIGAPLQKERMAKFNRLLEIESEN